MPPRGWTAARNTLPGTGESLCLWSFGKLLCPSAKASAHSCLVCVCVCVKVEYLFFFFFVYRRPGWTCTENLYYGLEKQLEKKQEFRRPEERPWEIKEAKPRGKCIFMTEEKNLPYWCCFKQFWYDELCSPKFNFKSRYVCNLCLWKSKKSKHG